MIFYVWLLIYTRNDSYVIVTERIDSFTYFFFVLFVVSLSHTHIHTLDVRTSSMLVSNCYAHLTVWADLPLVFQIKFIVTFSFVIAVREFNLPLVSSFWVSGLLLSQICSSMLLALSYLFLQWLQLVLLRLYPLNNFICITTNFFAILSDQLW